MILNMYKNNDFDFASKCKLSTLHWFLQKLTKIILGL